MVPFTFAVIQSLLLYTIPYIIADTELHSSHEMLTYLTAISHQNRVIKADISQTFSYLPYQFTQTTPCSVLF